MPQEEEDGYSSSSFSGGVEGRSTSEYDVADVARGALALVVQFQDSIEALRPSPRPHRARSSSLPRRVR